MICYQKRIYNTITKIKWYIYVGPLMLYKKDDIDQILKKITRGGKVFTKNHTSQNNNI